MTAPLWQPSPERIAGTNLTAFMARVERDWGVKLADYDDVYDWSVAELEKFWSSVWDFCGVIAETRGETVLADGDKMPGAKFFPDARLSFAENLLRRRDGADAMVFRGEDKVRRRLSHAQLYDQVSRLAQAFQAMGVGAGDRVAGFLPNLPETAIGALAANAIGAIWSSCSPDFGVRGVLDRFGQIEPKVLICADGYFYNGKAIDSLARVKAVAAELPSLARIVVVPYLSQTPDLSGLDGSGLERAVAYGDFLAPFEAREIPFKRMDFNAPLVIMYSSGTTGQPKCIVHGQGGTLLQHLKEHRLQCDVKRDDRVFYFTTCGWMMWNWLVSALASEATLLLYDGAPFHPDANALFDFAEAERCTLFGTSAKYIAALEKAGIEVRPGPHDFMLTVPASVRVSAILEACGDRVVVQDAVAAAVAPFTGPARGARVLDYCAAPGGKTTHLADLVGPEGSVTACDIDAGRLQLVAQNAERLGLGNIACKHLPADLDDDFDAVLVDAPCSNSGVLARRPEVRWRVRRKHLPGLAERQLHILRLASAHVAPAGVLVYSTCSLEPAENRGVVEAFTAAASFELEQERTIYPDEGCGDGGFHVRLRRV